MRSGSGEALRRLLAVFTAQCLVGSQMVFAAGSIVPDGNTATRVVRDGAVSNIHTDTVQGRNAINSFRHFSVGQGETANLHVPDRAQNLLNLVHDSATRIDGTLNSLKNGEVGGNVYFANPHGFVVGRSGTVNTGSLHISTPTPEYMQGFFDEPGVPSAAAAQALIAGEVPVNPGGLVSIEGRVNAQQQIRIDAGRVDIRGGLAATGNSGLPVAVNTDGLISGGAIVERDGELWIGAADEVIIQDDAELAADRRIEVRGGDVQLRDQAVVRTEGPGEILVMATGIARLADRARIDAGEGGSVEFSAEYRVELAGGHLAAGETGSILIDPEELVVATDILRSAGGTLPSGVSWDGADLTLEADRQLTVSNGVIISTRQVSPAGSQSVRDAHRNNPSTGASGNLTLSARKIEVQSGAALLAHTESGSAFAAGDIRLNAVDDATTPVFGSFENQDAGITITGATLRGRQLRLSSSADDRFEYGGEVADKVLGFLDNFSTPIDVTVSTATATVLIDGGSTLMADSDVEITASANTDASMFAWSTGVAFGWAEVRPTATITVADASVHAGGDLRVASFAGGVINNNVSAVNTGFTNPLAANANKYIDLAMAISQGDLTATTTIAADATVTATGEAVVAAQGYKKTATTANGKAYDDGTAGAALAVSEYHVQVDALVDGSLTAQAITLSADLVTENNATTASSGSGTGIIGAVQRYIDPRAWAGGLLGRASQFVSKTTLSSRATGVAESFGLAASFAWIDQRNEVTATASGLLTTAGDLDVQALAVEDLTYRSASSVDTARIGGNQTAKTVALSAAVAVADLENITQASIDDGAVVNAGGDIEVTAFSDIPPPIEQWGDWSDVDDFQDGVDKVFDLLTDSTFSLITGWTQAFAESDKFSLSASANFLTVDNSASAWVGDGAWINQTSGGSGDLSVLARAESSTFNLAGVFGFNPLKAFTGTQSGNTGFGGAYVDTEFNGGADASIGADALVTANKVAVLAHTDASAINIGESGGTAGKVSINGVYSEATLNNVTIAQVAPGGTLQASDLLVAANDDSVNINGAGGIGSGKAVGVGVSVSFTESNRNTQAIIGNTPDDLRRETDPSEPRVANASDGSVTLDNNLAVLADNNGELWNVSIAGAFASAVPASADDAGNTKGGLGIAGDVSINRIDDTTRAGVSDGVDLRANRLSADAVDVDLSLQDRTFGVFDHEDHDPDSDSLITRTLEMPLLDWGTVSAPLLSFTLAPGIDIAALNTSSLQSYSGAVTIAPSASGGIGIDTAINRLGGTTEAFVTGTGTLLEARDVTINAEADSDIATIAVAVGASQKVGFAGSVVSNHLTSETTARVSDGASITADNNVAVLAQGDDRIQSAAGSAGIGANAAGIGASITVNNIGNTTQAYVEGSGTRVNARAAGNGITVADGGLVNDVDLGAQVELGTYARLDLKGERQTRMVEGLAVNAAASQHVEVIGANIAGSGNIAVGLVENITTVGGLTSAYIHNAQINQDANHTADAAQQVDVRAGNIAFGNGFVGNIAAGKGAAGVGEDLYSIVRTTNADVLGGRIDAQDAIRINALAMQGVSSIVVGGSIGAIGFAGSLAMVVARGVTTASADRSVIDTGSLEVKADADLALHQVGGALTVGSSGLGGAFVVSKSEATTQANLLNLSGFYALDVDGDVDVLANNSTTIKHVAVSGALAGGVGVAGMFSLHQGVDVTEALVDNSTLGSSGAKIGSLNVQATHALNIRDIAGALGVGLSGTGIGAGASVNIAKARTTATLSGSQVHSQGDVVIDAASNKRVEAWSLTAGIGNTAGIGGAAAVVLVGDDVRDESADELDQGSLEAVDEFAGAQSMEPLESDHSSDYLLTDAERTTVNAERQTEVAATARGNDIAGYTHRTAASVIDSSIASDAGIDVFAADRIQTTSVVGGFGISLGLGLGGGVGVTQTKAQVLASVDADSELTAGGAIEIDAQVGAIDDGASAVDILALAGGGGLVGLGAAVAIGDADNRVTAELGGAVIASAQTVSVDAADSSAVDLEAYGGSIGAAAGGAVIVRADKSSDIQARTLDGANVSAGSLAINAESSGKVYGKTLGAAGGVFIAGTGADTEATDAALIQAYGGDNNVLTLDGALVIDATAHPDVYAEARGYGGSLLVNIGIALADASVTSGSYADLGENTLLNADSLELGALQTNTADAENVRAFAIAAGGSLYASITASSATARNVGVAETAIGSNSDLTLSGAATIAAETFSSQAARVDGYQGALGAARGSTLAIAEYNTRQSVDLGDGLGLSAASLRVDAGGRDGLFAESYSGQGALLASRAAAEASTQGRSDTMIRIGSQVGNSTVRSDDLVLSAVHEAAFNGYVNSSNGALIGLSGATLRHDIASDVSVDFAAGLDIGGHSLFAEARNVSSKPDLGKENAKSGSGGFYDGPAVTSTTLLENTAAVTVGEGAHLTVDGDPDAPGALRLRAANVVDLFDKVNLDSGGAIANAKGVSHLDADRNDATVSIGENATLRSIGDIELASIGDVDAQAEVYVDTYGLSGSGQGDSRARIRVDNQTLLGAGSLVRAEGDLVLSAGADSNGDGVLDAHAKTKLWNKTVVPFNTDPEAHGEIEQSNLVQIDTGAQALSVGDVSLLASNGSHTVTGDGTGTDAYREAAEAVGNFFGGLVGADEVSLDIQRGSPGAVSAAGVQVDGEARAGIQHHQLLAFAADGSVLLDSDGNPIQSEGVSFTEQLNVSLNNELQTRINALQALADEYRDSDPDVSLAFQTEADFLSLKLSQLGGDTVIVDFFEIDDILARSGDVVIAGDYLQGAGLIEAPGDALISIWNASDHFLNVNRLTIPEDQGGHLLMNGVPVHTNADIVAKNDGADAPVALTLIDAESSAEPQIEILSTNVGADPLAGVFLNEDISNKRGLVSVYSEGDIAASADIDALSVELKAGRDVMLGYIYGFRHLGGDPVGHQPFAGFPVAPRFDYARDPAAEVLPASSGITAGNNVFISAEKLNINTVIESGRPYRAVTIDSVMTSGVAAFQLAFDAALAGGGSPDPLLALNFTPGDEASLDTEHVRAWYNAETARIELEPMRVEGGNIVLFGDIFSTGNGRLKAVDGYGRIQVDNQTPYALELRTADTGAGEYGIEGRVQITDTARRSVIDTPLTTVYTRLGDVIQNELSYLDADRNKVVVAAGPDALASDGRNTVYQPLEDRRFHWVNGRTTRTDEDRIYTTRVLFGVDWLIADYDNPDSTSSSSTFTQRISGDYLANESSDNDYQHDYSSSDTGFFKRRSDSESRSCWPSNTVCAQEDVTVTAYFRRYVYETFNHSIAADKQIEVDFSGWDQGDLSINSNGPLYLTGRVRNQLGNTLINANQGIYREGNDAVVIGQNVTLSAPFGGIGELTGDAMIDVDLNGSVLNLIARDDIRVHEQDGDLTIGQVVSLEGDVDLSADLGIYAAAPVLPGAAHVSGGSVSLASAYGSIGESAVTPLVIDSDATSGGVVSAQAAGDVYLVEALGDLNADRIASLGGQVHLRVPGGRLLDVNGDNLVDLDAERALRESLADELGLLDPAQIQAREDAAVAAYEAGVNADYGRYWQDERNLQVDPDGQILSDPYDPDVTFAYAANERTALSNAGWSEAEIVASETLRTARYREFGRSAYDPTFAYSAGADERTALTEGSGWSLGEITNVLPRGLFVRTVADTEARIEAPNLVGRDIDLDAAVGIGEDRGTVTILEGTMTSALSDEQLLALGAAERSDVRVLSDRIEVVQREDVDIEQLANGSVRASSTGPVYLGGETALDLLSLVGSDVRVKVAGTLQAAAGAMDPLVQGASVILESAGGAIGSAGAPLRVAVNGPTGRLTARAATDVYIEQSSGDLPLEFVFAGDTAWLQTGGRLLDANIDFVTDIRAENIELNAAGVGSDSLTEAYLDVGHNPSGQIDVVATDGLYLFSPTFDLEFGALETDGDARVLAALGAIVLTEPATAGGDLALRAAGDVRGVGDQLHLSADSLELRSDGGWVGEASQPLIGHSDTDVTLQGELGVNFQHRGGDLLSPLVRSESGPVVLVVTNGDARIDTLDGEQVSVQLHNEGGLLQVSELAVTTRLEIAADVIELPDVQHQGSGELVVAIGGNDGGAADSLLFSVTSGGNVRYESLKGGDVTLAFGSDDVELRGLQVGERAEFVSPTHHIVVDNVSRTLDPDATALLFAPDRTFDLVLTSERHFYTDALLVDYSPYYIANRFSTENSLVRLMSKRHTGPTRTGERLRQEGGLMPAGLLHRVFAAAGARRTLPRLVSVDEFLLPVPASEDAGQIILID